MTPSPLPCLSEAVEAETRVVHAVAPASLDAFLAGLPPMQASWLRDSGFRAAAGAIAPLPGPEGFAAAALGLGEDGPWSFGGLSAALPAGTDWRVAGADPAAATLGFCLGAYQYETFRPRSRAPARLAGYDAAAARAAAVLWRVRDLINMPANLLGPAELADALATLAARYGAECHVTSGDALVRLYPLVAAVGQGSARPPLVARLAWRSLRAAAAAPLLSICGKGVCFDTGGYDLKPAAAMLRMKKDMGGAALALGLAELIMDADLPVALELRLGCVENSVSGQSFRPLDVLRTRAGPTVEIGNTDAEGRLVLCDLLAEAAAARPAVLLDFATLTGAARVALGPDLPALFCNNDVLARELLAGGLAAHDPLWRLPLHDGYESWLESRVADLNNVSQRPAAGAIVAALFLRRFVPRDVAWAHFDVYAWNDSDRPGRPEGGEAQAIRGVFNALSERFAES